MSVLSGGDGVIPRLKETPADAQLFERVPPDHLIISTNLVRVPSFCICFAKVLRVRVPDTRLALTDEISVDMKQKYLVKLYHGHEHLPVQPACRNNIATQELVDEIDALLMD